MWGLESPDWMVCGLAALMVIQSLVMGELIWRPASKRHKSEPAK